MRSLCQMLNRCRKIKLKYRLSNEVDFDLTKGRVGGRAKVILQQCGEWPLNTGYKSKELGCEGMRITSLKVTEDLGSLVLKRWGTLDFRLMERGYWETGEYSGRGEWLDESPEEEGGDKGITGRDKEAEEGSLPLRCLGVNVQALRGSQFIRRVRPGHRGGPDEWKTSTVSTLEKEEELTEVHRRMAKWHQGPTEVRSTKSIEVWCLFSYHFPGTVLGVGDAGVNPQFLTSNCHCFSFPTGIQSHE